MRRSVRASDREQQSRQLRDAVKTSRAAPADGAAADSCGSWLLLGHPRGVVHGEPQGVDDASHVGPRRALVPEPAERVGAEAPSLMQLHNLTIRNVVVTGARQAGKIECGNGTHACDGLTMTNVTMRDFGQGWECVGEVEGSAEGCEPKPCF